MADAHSWEEGTGLQGWASFLTASQPLRGGVLVHVMQPVDARYFAAPLAVASLLEAAEKPRQGGTLAGAISA